ncbi:MAG: Pyruvate carboxylase subunit B [Candidatus Argoarchaeum ethanivorans]|uniref:Pyruvate carboxylase subunit B n=1 Tax=Candidatus Argoarchaeum ethanivorans TaxID=2608793 RepID=A0A811TAK0_9EURY|nr:MAG: Pyruvate carboxylase subunit B [Candidatus Argoarchaeum ethanivorans]
MVKVRITDTTFRDAHQSLFATRMRTYDMIPIAKQMDEAGFYSIEAWGGATFDSCIRFLNDDPWERIQVLYGIIKKTPLQMLLRGQNLVGYRHYADDVVEKFVELAAKNGVGVFRIFDALNDIRNMTTAIKAVIDTGSHVQGAVCYTISPVHTIEKYVKMAEELEAMECDSLCIKDMAGLISPKAAFDLITALKERISIPVCLHSHCTSGMAPLSYMMACEAGVDILDTAFSPFSGGTSQPSTEAVVAAFRETDCDTGLSLTALSEIKKYFEKLREKYGGLIDPISERIDTNVLIYQIPGGMISNLVSQLKEQNALERFDDVLEEMPRVREDLGYPPLVTPTSQIVGTQAVLNVLMGERYKVIPREVKDYAKGLYGKTPVPINRKLLEKILPDEELITARPADLISPELEKLTKEAEEQGLLKKEEDAMTYALYPAIAPKFLRGELTEEPLPQKTESVQPVSSTTMLTNTEFKVEVDGESFDVKIVPADGGLTSEVVESKKPEIGKDTLVASMQGMMLKIIAKTGEQVEKDDVVAVLEAMKMENNIHAHKSGVIREIYVEEGSTVSSGEAVMLIE